MVAIGNKLKTLREEKKLTQKDVAQIFSVTPQTISKWELNKSAPDLDSLVKLCTFYQVTADELLGLQKPAFLFQFFPRRKGRKLMNKDKKMNAYQRLTNLAYRRKYHITFLDRIPNFEAHPALAELGIWHIKTGKTWTITIQDPDTPLNDVAIFRATLAQRLNLAEDQFQIEKDSAPFVFYGL